MSYPAIKFSDLIFPIYVSNEIKLDIINLQHCNSFFNLVDKNKDYLRQGVTWVDQCNNYEQMKKFICNSLESMRVNHRLRLGVFLNNKIVGSILLVYSSNNNSIELGYWVDHSHQGKGIIRNSCKILLETTLKDFAIKEYLIYTTIDNNKSQKLAYWLGFVIQNDPLYRRMQYNGAYKQLCFKKKL